MNPDVIKHLVSMRHSPLRNYIVPGLTSWMIMDNGSNGKVRMFDCTREQHEFITPHSHRFDFTACVVEGSVENALWISSSSGDDYQMTRTIYLDEPGKYESQLRQKNKYTTDVIGYKEGDWYGMKFNEIHSIKFAKGSKVLFFEGPTKVNFSYVLEPVVDGEHLKTMRTEPWMFKRG
jgi:hypothetical protein